MKSQNLETQLSRGSEMNSSLSVNQRLINALRSLQEQWVRSWDAGEKEREITETQREVYGMRNESFNYGKAGWNPEYGSQVLNPFMEILRRNNKAPLVLDLGAGKAAASLYMEAKGMKAIKVDISNLSLRGRKNAVQASSWRLPFSDGSFDGIHCKDMVTHIPPEFRNRLFSEIARVIKPGGVALLCVARGAGVGNYQYHISEGDLTRLAKKQNFTVENVKEWKPSREYRDWYLDRRQRFVLELRKKSGR